MELPSLADDYCPMTNSSIAVVLLCRNRPHYLEAALQSIVEQTLPEFVVTVSDNSSDPNAALENQRQVERFSQHRKVEYIRRSGGLSMCEHCHSALNQASGRGEFVALHNDDDIWLAHHLQTAQKALEELSATGLFVPNAFIIDASGQRTGESISAYESPQEWSQSAQLAFWSKSAWGAFPGFVIRSSAIPTIPFYESQMVDVWIALWILAQDLQIRYHSEPTLLYRRHSQQITETGQTLLVDRHRMRMQMGLRYAGTFLPRYPGLLAKMAKSSLSLLLLRGAIKQNPAR